MMYISEADLTIACHDVDLDCFLKAPPAPAGAHESVLSLQLTRPPYLGPELESNVFTATV
jgi:hypothetical protein